MQCSTKSKLCYILENEAYQNLTAKERASVRDNQDKSVHVK